MFLIGLSVLDCPFDYDAYLSQEWPADPLFEPPQDLFLELK